MDRADRQARDTDLRRGHRISRADLADAILASLHDPEPSRPQSIGYQPMDATGPIRLSRWLHRIAHLRSIADTLS